jgi:hypothetical protein
MSKEQITSPTTEGPQVTSNSLADLQRECQRLQQALRHVEEERDQYRHALYALARKQFTQAELTTIPDEKDCVPLSEFLAELEEIAGTTRCLAKP